MLCKVRKIAVSALFPVLLKLKRKQKEFLLRDAIVLSAGRSWMFAQSLDNSFHSICASNGRILKKTALEEGIRLTLSPT